MVVAKGYLTLEQFLRLPERKPALEYEDGRVTQKVSPKLRHAALQIELAILIDQFARPRKLARAFPELRTTYANRSVVPDVAVYRWDRIPRTPAGELEDDALTPPDVAIEITSPGQSVRDLIAKCRRSVELGAAIALLVDVRRRSVRVFRPGQPERLLRGADRIDLDEVLPGFELTVDQLYATLRVE